MCRIENQVFLFMCIFLRGGMCYVHGKHICLTFVQFNGSSLGEMKFSCSGSACYVNETYYRRFVLCRYVQFVGGCWYLYVQEISRSR